ncbi:SBBP repeat-containing protein [Hugenholtzia roseola]|uniref:SBBP repeat-containing protein n=1 Tax=Hugenholtzia roseola TaxID=1002 RepID=UPI00068419EC|nr:SBBP repeat-containing protein [Hugenholtzia roseola]
MKKTIFSFVVILACFLAGQARAQNYAWAKGMGSTGQDDGRGIAVDGSGNVYTIGTFQGTVDFDPNAGTANLSSVIGLDVFVQKLDASGNLVWAKRLGGTLGDAGCGISVDGSGNVYTTGSFQGTVDFDPNAGTAELTAAGNSDIFIQKLDASGNLVWAKRMGSLGDDVGRGISVDGLGNVYTTGYFVGKVDFDPNAGTTELTAAGGSDIFIQKLDASGNLVWAKRLGSTSSDVSNGISVDGSGNVYTTGYFRGTVDFDPNAGTNNLISEGFSLDIFVQKLDASGNLVWAKGMGGIDEDFGNGISVDGSGNVYTIGRFGMTVDFDPNAGTAELTAEGSRDIFVQKLDASGNLVWAKSMGGASLDTGNGISVDGLGNVYTTGSFGGTVDFDPNAGTAELTATDETDIFVQKLDASGSLVWAKSVGGKGWDSGYGIAIDGSGNVYTTGSFQSTVDFDPNADTAELTAAGSWDIFVSKLTD